MLILTAHGSFLRFLEFKEAHVGRPLGVLVGLLLLLVEVLIEVLAELVSLVEAHAARLTLKLVRLEKQRLRNDVRPTAR